MLMEMFKWMAGGIDLVHVPYKGASPAMIDQISGQIDVAFSTAIAALPFVQQGKVRAIAVSTKDRFPPLPDLPTVEQGGIKGYDGSSWQGVVMPANTPRDMVAKANAELVKMLKSPDMKEKILLQGGIAIGNSPDEFARLHEKRNRQMGESGESRQSEGRMIRSRTIGAIHVDAARFRHRSLFSRHCAPRARR